eukprot:6210790-Pleurochrysis_carterae.AAC.1
MRGEKPAQLKTQDVNPTTALFKVAHYIKLIICVIESFGLGVQRSGQRLQSRELRYRWHRFISSWDKRKQIM